MLDANYGGVIWDMDGTLVDTAELHFEAWRVASQELGQDESVESRPPALRCIYQPRPSVPQHLPSSPQPPYTVPPLYRPSDTSQIQEAILNSNAGRH